MGLQPHCEFSEHIPGFAGISNHQLSVMSAKTLQSTEDRTVKRFLRHRSSREYFKHGSWTSDPAEADSFSDVVEVAETCAKYGLSDVELTLRYGSAGHDLFCTTIR